MAKINRAARRAADQAPVRAETEAEKIARLRALRMAKEAGVPVPPPAVLIPAPKGAPVLRSQAPDAPAPTLDMIVVDRAERRHVPPPPRHAPELEAARDAFIARKAVNVGLARDLVAEAARMGVTAAELTAMLQQLARAQG